MRVALAFGEEQAADLEASAGPARRLVLLFP